VRVAFALRFDFVRGFFVRVFPAKSYRIRVSFWRFRQREDTANRVRSLREIGSIYHFRGTSLASPKAAWSVHGDAGRGSTVATGTAAGVGGPSWVAMTFEQSGHHQMSHVPEPIGN
jgi:hypothetical protein